MRSVGGLLREQTPEPHYHHTQQIKNIYYGGVIKGVPGQGPKRNDEDARVAVEISLMQ